MDVEVIVSDDSDSAEAWMTAMVVKGHTPITWAGKLEPYALDTKYHNGPGCSVCGWGTCWHCDAIDNIPDCSSREAPRDWDQIPPL